MMFISTLRVVDTTAENQRFLRVFFFHGCRVSVVSALLVVLYVIRMQMA